MQFWMYQEQAKRLSVRILLLYFIILVIFVFLAAASIEYVWRAIDLYNTSYYYKESAAALPFFRPRFWFILISFLLAIFLASQLSPISLSQKGWQIAEQMKARRVTTQTGSNRERVLLNVVAEMSIASGVPMPPVYILDNESGINAFAAGASQSDAVIGVTSGALEHLSRDELQAVVAHEFSHILNGDSRLNMRVGKLLFGLMFMWQLGKGMVSLFTSSGNSGSGSSGSGSSGASRSVRRSSSRGSSGSGGKGAGAIILLVLAIILITLIFGIISNFLGKIVQAAVCRQREFLADASSVQFTRTTALASALKKIAALPEGSSLRGNYWLQSHLFFGSTKRSLFATHPPLKTRISRLEPDWNGELDAQAAAEVTSSSTSGVASDSASETVSANASGMTSANAPDEANTNLSGEASFAAPPLTPLASVCHSLTSAPLNPTVWSEENALAPDAPDCGPEKQPELFRCFTMAAQEPVSACNMVLAMLLSPFENQRQAQLRKHLQQQNSVRIYSESLARISWNWYVPLLELASPALRSMSGETYADFRQTMLKLIGHDGQFSFKEWIIFQTVETIAGTQFAPRAKRAGADKARINDATAKLLSALAATYGDSAERDSAFADAQKKISGEVRLTMQPAPSAAELEDSVRILRAAQKKDRQKLLELAIAMAQHDSLVSAPEKMYTQMLALCLDLPAPHLASDSPASSWPTSR
ncbi:M48 family metalloprotease [Desulfovibrio sp. OttesenSCG-928-C06]|nr:M48 family metalloprotease [Desulfovibrio sp. OttesenSCG-928-C06]